MISFERITKWVRRLRIVSFIITAIIVALAVLEVMHK